VSTPKHIHGFIGVLVTEMLPDGRNLRVLRRFGFRSETGMLWTAMEGDETDGASIPRLFWRVCGSPFVGKYRRAAVLHDCAYRNRISSRLAADQMFREASLYDGVPQWKACVMYLMVRLFGPRW
jgi:hypothetical protein